MKKIQAVVACVPLLLAVSAFAADAVVTNPIVTLSPIPAEMKIGVPLEIKFVVSGVESGSAFANALYKRSVPGNPYTWAAVLEFILVSNGVRIAEITFDQRCPFLVRGADGSYSGSFAWSGRVFSYTTGLVVWVDPGQYTILLGMMDKTTYGGGEYTFTKTTEPYTMWGNPPDLLIESYPNGDIWVYCSGLPDHSYTLMSSRDFIQWFPLEQFVIPTQGMHAVLVGGKRTVYGDRKFFRLIKAGN